MTVFQQFLYISNTLGTFALRKIFHLYIFLNVNESFSSCVIETISFCIVKIATFTIFYNIARMQDACVKGTKFHHSPISVCGQTVNPSRRWASVTVASHLWATHDEEAHHRLQYFRLRWNVNKSLMLLLLAILCICQKYFHWKRLENAFNKNMIKINSDQCQVEITICWGNFCKKMKS